MSSNEPTIEYWIDLGKRKGLLVENDELIIYKPSEFQDIITDPEEKIRAAFFVELVDHYKYPEERISFEVETPRREPRDYADIVIYKDDDLSDCYCSVECKSGNLSENELEQAVKQAGGNANNLGAKFGMLVTRDIRIVFQAKDWDPRRPIESGVIADLPISYGKAPKYRYWKNRDDYVDLSVVNEKQLTTAFQRCHDILWEGGRRNPAEAFDEMSKLMFCKLQDERFHTTIGEKYDFQAGTNESVGDVANRVHSIYQEAQETAPKIFQSPINSSDELIYRVVKVLQWISLDRMDLDVKGAAFEKFLGVVFRGEMGQYFTHRNLVNFVVEMLDPTRRDKIIDPACGSGGFLLQAMEKIRDDAYARLAPENATDAWKRWALRRLHGIEINEQISRIAMMGMIIYEDGHTNIKCADALQNFEELNRMEDGISITPETYTLVMTNPPFGAKVVRANKHADHPYLDLYDLGSKQSSRSSQNTEILFIERCLQLLEPGTGRMAIVLPDGILTNSTLQYVRDYIMDKAVILAVISLPGHAFMPAGAGVKASILFLRKRDAEDDDISYPIFMAQAEHIGYTATGSKDINQLDEIVEAYQEFKDENEHLL